MKVNEENILYVFTNALEKKVLERGAILDSFCTIKGLCG